LKDRIPEACALAVLIVVRSLAIPKFLLPNQFSPAIVMVTLPVGAQLRQINSIILGCVATAQQA
jgi:hypothetical protein